MKYGVVIPVCGRARLVQAETLQEMRSAVGGYIEAVPETEDWVRDFFGYRLVVDECGMLKPKPEHNAIASLLTSMNLYGPALVLKEVPHNLCGMEREEAMEVLDSLDAAIGYYGVQW